MKIPTHTVIECQLDLAQVEDMLYDKYIARMKEVQTDPLVLSLARMGNIDIYADAEGRASKWADQVIRELQMDWKARILKNIEIHLEEEYINPYDDKGEWDCNPTLSRMLTLATQDQWDMVVSECLAAFTRMGDAFPINLTSDEWLDIRIIKLDTTTDN